MRPRPAALIALLLPVVLATAACGDDDGVVAGDPATAPDAEGTDDADDAGREGTDADDGAGGDLTTGDRTADCDQEPPRTITVEGGDQLPGIDSTRFEVTSVIATQQPIVPDADGELDTEEIRARAADTPIVAYTIYLADFDIEEANVGTFGASPPADGSFLSLSVAPPTEDGLAAGDVVVSGTPEYDTVTTLSTVGTGYGTGTADDVPSLASDAEGSGRVEVLSLTEDRICLAWSHHGTFFGADAEGEWSLDIVVAADLAPRSDLPFT